jgi:TRAP-type C4-dicarboxylate transport system, small permease component
MDGNYADRQAGPLDGLARRLIEAWALFGGFVLLGIVFMQTASVVMGAFGAPLPGDFEMTEVWIAVAAFAFLPYCQLTGANVTADIFTSGAGPKFITAMSAVTSLIALAFAVIMAWRSWHGMLDQFAYDAQTAILGFRIGYAFIPIVISLVLLAVAALVTLADALRGETPAREAGGE